MNISQKSEASQSVSFFQTIKLSIVRTAILIYWIINKFGYKLTSGAGFLTRTLKFPFTFNAHGIEWSFDEKIGTGYGMILGWGWNEPETWDFIYRLVRSNDSKINVIDIGAHLGEYAIPLTKISRISQIYAYEPIPLFAACLARTCALNRLENKISLRTMALGSTRGSTEFEYSEKSPTGAHKSDQNINQVNDLIRTTVEVSTLDAESKLLHMDASRCTLIIIDVEGYELDVIKGSVEFIRKNQPVIIFEFNEISKSHFSIKQVQEILGSDYFIKKISKKGVLLSELVDTWNCVALPKNGNWKTGTYAGEFN